MTKLFNLTLVLMSFSFWTQAQIKGQLQSSSQEALPFANIILRKASDSSMVKGVQSQSDGSFIIEGVGKGDYILQTSMIGFQPFFTPPFSFSGLTNNKDFGIITVQEETLLLDGVNVTAKAVLVEQSMEGITLNVQNSMMSKGSSALELLERSPGVIIDQRNKNFSLNGQSGTLVMINGKPVRMSTEETMNLLSGMSADNVEKVELLTNPGARYDADGTAGIINIQLKKDEDQGTNGSIAATGAYGWGPKETISANINHRTAKTNYFSNYAFTHDNTFSKWQGVGLSQNPARGGQTSFDFKSQTISNKFNHNLMLGIEQQLNNSLLLGINTTYTYMNNQSDIQNAGLYITLPDNHLNLLVQVDGTTQTHNLSNNLFIEKRLQNEGKISVDANYIFYQNKNTSLINNTYTDRDGAPAPQDNKYFTAGNKGKSNTRIDIGVAKVDWEHPVSKKIKLETGIKGTISKSTNAAQIEQLNEGQWSIDERNITNLEITEKIGAGYASMQWSPSTTLSITAGVRYEYWDSDYNDPNLNKSYGKLFPSIFLSKQLKDEVSLQAAYNKRISRPSYNDLASYLQYNDPTSVFSGNPFLQPAVSDNYKLGVSFKGKSINLVYLTETNPIAKYQMVENDSSDLAIIAPQNLGYLNNLALQINIPIEPTKWWTMSIGGNTFYRSFQVTHTNTPVEKDYFGFELYGNQNFLLPKNFSIELSGFYNSERYNGSTKDNGLGMLNLGIKKELNNNKGILQFTATDLLNSMTGKPTIGTLTREAFDTKANVQWWAESAIATIYKITYSRTLGNNGIKKRKYNSIGAKEEKSRIN